MDICGLYGSTECVYMCFSHTYVVTDANLLLGRIRAEDFPSIFGPDQNEPLDVQATTATFDEMTSEINTFLKQQAEDEATPYKEMKPHEV